MGQITNLDDRYDMKCITLNACKKRSGRLEKWSRRARGVLLDESEYDLRKRR